MDLMKSIAIAASGLRAQTGRMQVISENIANAESTPSQAGGDPYRRQIVTFRSEMDSALGVRVVQLGAVRTRSDEVWPDTRSAFQIWSHFLRKSASFAGKFTHTWV